MGFLDKAKDVYHTIKVEAGAAYEIGKINANSLKWRTDLAATKVKHKVNEEGIKGLKPSFNISGNSIMPKEGSKEVDRVFFKTITIGDKDSLTTSFIIFLDSKGDLKKPLCLESEGILRQVLYDKKGCIILYDIYEKPSKFNPMGKSDYGIKVEVRKKVDDKKEKWTLIELENQVNRGYAIKLGKRGTVKYQGREIKY